MLALEEHLQSSDSVSQSVEGRLLEVLFRSLMNIAVNSIWSGNETVSFTVLLPVLRLRQRVSACCYYAFNTALTLANIPINKEIKIPGWNLWANNNIESKNFF